MYDPVDHLAELGWYYYRRGEYAKTVQYYEQAFARRTKHPDYYYHLTASAYALLENKDKALKYLHAAPSMGGRTLNIPGNKRNSASCRASRNGKRSGAPWNRMQRRLATDVQLKTRPNETNSTIPTSASVTLEYIGNSCILITAPDGTCIVTDPYHDSPRPPACARLPGDLRADAVTRESRARRSQQRRRSGRLAASLDRCRGFQDRHDQV